MLDYINMNMFKIVYDKVDNELKRTQYTEYILHDDNESFDIVLEYLKTLYTEKLYVVSIERIDTNTYYIKRDS